MKSVLARNAPMSAPLRPHLARPPVQSSAWLAAKSSGVWPALVAWASSIHGRKSAGARFGNVRQRLVRSPLGSIASTGSPARSASSIRITPSPVLPDPVIPTITPCVVSESVGTATLPDASVAVRSCVAGSIDPPRNRSAMAFDSSGEGRVPGRDGDDLPDGLGRSLPETFDSSVDCGPVVASSYDPVSCCSRSRFGPGSCCDRRIMRRQ